MSVVRFTVRDAEILYSIPKTPSDLVTLIRIFTFINRAAPPTYDELAGCLKKAAMAGIISENDGIFFVEDGWYSRIHAADDVSDNEIDSMLEFEETFVDIDFPCAPICGFVLSQAEYQMAIERVGLPF